MPRLLLCALSLLLAAPSAAGAASLTALPDTTSTGTKLRLAADGSEFGGKVPSALALRIARGFDVDLSAVKLRCEDADAEKSACPVESQVGEGSAAVEVSSPFGTQDYQATLRVYLAPARQAGDLAGVVVVVDFQGERNHAKGRLVELPDGPFGHEVRFDSFPTPAVPPGVTVRLERLDLETGVSRQVRVTVKCKKRSKTCRPVRKGCTGKRCKLVRTRLVRRYLLTTPGTCTGSWPAQAEARFADGTTQIVDAPAACRAG